MQTKLLLAIVCKGGNHFLMGASVRGGLVHGDYPDNFSPTGPLNIGRGRLIPTTPWEGMWKGVAEVRTIIFDVWPDHFLREPTTSLSNLSFAPVVWCRA